MINKFAPKLSTAQRFRAVLAVFDGHPVATVAKAAGVSAQTINYHVLSLGPDFCEFMRGMELFSEGAPPIVDSAPRFVEAA